MLSNLFILCMQVMCWDNPPIVETTMGKIKGQYRTTQGDTTFSAFEGIPYAQPPVEQLRFKEPFPAAQWHNTLEANTTHTCIQMTEDNKIIGTEDCLYLNIYVPGQKINTRNNFNVLVHLHAGEFSFSSGHSYTNPDNLMENNFILVTLNYRLGIMGFLSTEDHIVPGNNGLKDQVMALKWIQENIKYFGGNHDSVMLTGIEAGGASVHFHYFSKFSKNIFHYGLSESGTALNPWALQDDARHKAVKIATSVQCPSGDSLEMVDCLREKPADLLVGKFILFISSGFPVAPFAPVVEKHVDDTTFLRDHPYRLLLEGNFQHLPWVVGISDYEGKNLVRRINVNRLKMLWKMSAPSILDYKNTIGRHKWNMVAKEIYNFYSKRAPNESVTNNTIAEILHDRLFLMDTELAVKLQTRTSEAQVHYYQHQNDSLKCIFSKKCDKFLQMLREYASKGIPSFEDINWPPEDFSQLTYLQINNEEIVINTKEDNTVEEFWSHLGFRENQHLFN